MTPEHAVDAHRILTASTSIATHFGTFALADDSMTAPTDRLEAALRAHSPRPDFRVLAEGESLPRALKSLLKVIQWDHGALGNV